MRHSVAGVLLLCFVVFMLNGRALPEVDCVAASYIAWSQIRHGSYDLQHYSDLKCYVGESIKKRPDGAWLSMRAPGSATVFRANLCEPGKSWQRRAAHCLVDLSVGIHLLGIFGYRGYEAWQRRYDLDDQGRCLFALKDTQIEAHARALMEKLRK